MTRTGLSRTVLALIAVYAAVSFFIYLFSPFAGDDYVYKAVFEGPQLFSDDWSDLLLWARMHRVSANARFFNLVLPALLSLDRVILAAASSAMTALMLFCGLRLAGRAAAGGMYGVLFVAAMAWILPWWDSMSIFACQENYVWASALILLSLCLMYRPPEHWFTLILAAGVCAVAGATHEGGTLPLAVGMAVYGMLVRPRPGRSWFLVAAFVIGTLFVSLAPGIISRAGQPRLADDPVLILTLKTVPAVLAMVVMILAMLFTHRWRELLRRLVFSPYIILITAAVASAVIAVASGIVGRSGWFAEIYALIVIFRVCSDCFPAGIRTGRIVAACVAVALTAQTAFVAAWQYVLGREYATFENLYTSSGEDIVYMDFTPHDSLPRLLLGRYRGVPDADDVYILHSLVGYLRPGAPLPVILPHAAQGIDLATVTDTILSDGDIICDRLPAGVAEGSTLREGVPLGLFEKDGCQWVARPFCAGGRTLYLLSRRVLDPGDR